MLDIHQAGVLWPSGLDEWSRGLWTVQVQRDGDDLNAFGMKLAAQCLPPGQVVATASIGRPGDENDFLPSQGRQPKLVPLQIRQDQLGSLR